MRGVDTFLLEIDVAGGCCREEDREDEDDDAIDEIDCPIRSFEDVD